MSITALREALQPQSSLWRRLLLASAAVAAVLIGLLAMHALNLESHHNEVALSQVATPDGHHHASADEAASFAAVDADHCSGDCGREHAMLGACILALAFGAIAVLGAALLSRWSSVGLTIARLLRVATDAVAAAPPSLVVLSISRT